MLVASGHTYQAPPEEVFLGVVLILGVMVATGWLLMRISESRERRERQRLGRRRGG